MEGGGLMTVSNSIKCQICGARLTWLQTVTYGGLIYSEKHGWRYGDPQTEEMAFECPKCGAEIDVPFEMMKITSQ